MSGWALPPLPYFLRKVRRNKGLALDLADCEGLRIEQSKSPAEGRAADFILQGVSRAVL